MKRSLLCATLLLSGLGSIASAQPVEPATGVLRVIPDLIEIATFYDGASVTVEGEAAAGSEILIVVRGPDKEESFNKKVRAGPIWISSGKVHISGVPSLFLAFTTAPARSILDDSVVEKEQMDLEAIRSQMHMDAGGDEIDEHIISDNYVVLKREQGIYAIENGAINFNKSSGGTFSLTFDWPRLAPPEEYRFTAYECRDSEIVTISRHKLELVEVGMPERLANMATEQSSLYGLISVLLAVSAGFGINFLATRLIGGKVSGGH